MLAPITWRTTRLHVRVTAGSRLDANNQLNPSQLTGISLPEKVALPRSDEQGTGLSTLASCSSLQRP